MLVKCICNDIRAIDAASDLGQEIGESFGTDTYGLDLTIDKTYVVYGVEVREGWVRYFIADDLYPRLLYPVAYLAAIFEVVDRRVSRCWSLAHEDGYCRSSGLLLAFEEWSASPTFYERLVDGSDEELGVFRKWKEFMDAEFDPITVPVLLPDDS